MKKFHIQMRTEMCIRDRLMSESDWEKLDQDNLKLRFSVVQGSITVNVK